MSGYTLIKIQTGDTDEIISIQLMVIDFKTLFIVKTEPLRDYSRICTTK